MTKCPECDVDLNALINSERLKAIAQEDNDWGFSHEQADETMGEMRDKTAAIRSEAERLHNAVAGSVPKSLMDLIRAMEGK
jgi:hypothetical protein